MIDKLLHLPLTSLSGHAKYVLSCLLNPLKLFLSEGLPRDWRGLAHILKISSEISNSIKNSNDDKTTKVLDSWVKRNDATATIGQLLQYLERLDRYDICDDLADFAKSGLLLSQESKDLVPLHAPIRREQEFITLDDQLYGKPQMYHAYVLYAQQEKHFADELIRRMKALGCKMCTIDDVLPGYSTQYVPVSQLLMERCRKIIVIYSESFFNNPTNVFFLNYAQAVSIEGSADQATSTKLLPCMYGDITRTRRVVPENLQFYFILVYDPHEERPIYNFWDKLALTLGVNSRTNGIHYSQPKLNGLSTNEIETNLSSLRVNEITSSQSECNPMPYSYSNNAFIESNDLSDKSLISRQRPINSVSEVVSRNGELDASVPFNRKPKKTISKAFHQSLVSIGIIKKKNKSKKKIAVEDM